MKSLRYLALTLILTAPLTACGGPLRYEVPSTAKAPGADAKIVADVQEDQHQTQLEVAVENLPPPGRIAEGSSTYVAWYRKDSHAVWARIGAIDFDMDARSGSLKGSVPEAAFDLEITAEADLSPASPSAHVVFSQHISK